MRLLELSDAGEVVPTKDLIGSAIPQYAILSHTWGNDGDEVVFSDLISNTAGGKKGYNKLLFTGKQSKADGIGHFWIDSCCIDKTNSTELQEAINSMFAWYRDADKCYVFLADVSVSQDEAEREAGPWESSFRRSRWFTRGWTLQELIAPTSVEFFSKEGHYLGNKQSLEWIIVEITGIPAGALRGGSLHTFTVSERMAWAASRQTTRAEDMAYSLLGIFGVTMPLIYGEGGAQAARRLRDTIDVASKGTHHADFAVSFSVDVPETERFVGRSDELSQIREILHGDGSRRAAVLHGLGGMGKTQLALAYAKRYKDSYSAIFWLNAKDENSIIGDFLKMARVIQRDHNSVAIPSTGGTEDAIKATIDAVKDWLSRRNNTRWLLIFDNYDTPFLPGSEDPAAIDIRKYLPDVQQGCILITTRSSRVQIGTLINIKKLASESESLDILLASSKRLGLKNDVDAIELTRQLDGLPLALATTGTYLCQTNITCAEYLQHYKSSWTKLQETSPRLRSYEDRTLYTTWQISLDNITRESELSAKLLHLWAYFDKDDLWFQLLQHTMDGDPPWLRELVQDELCFNRAVRILSDYGLVEPAPAIQDDFESGGYSMHACVHSWTIHVLNSDWNSELATIALRCVVDHVPSETDALWWVTHRRVLHHAAKYTDEKFMQSFEHADNSLDIYKLGDLYSRQGKFDDAEAIFRRALRRLDSSLNDTESRKLRTINNFSVLLIRRSKLLEAQSLLLRGLDMHQNAKQCIDFSVSHMYHNLTIVYQLQDKLDEAEDSHNMAYEDAFFNDDVVRLQSLERLASLKGHRKMYQEAMELHQMVLQGREKHLGADHVLTLRSATNVASRYKMQGKLKEAETLYERTLQGRERALGPDHVDTLRSARNLGALYVLQKKLGKAKEMFERALIGQEKLLGGDNIDTLQTVHSYANLYAEQDDFEEAEKLYRRALSGRERILGESHTHTLQTRLNLGRVLDEQQRLQEAEEVFLVALKRQQKAHGQRHQSTFWTLQKLGIVYEKQNRYDDAERVWKRALRGQWTTLGPDHIDTLQSIHNIGYAYSGRKKLKAAERVFTYVLEKRERLLGRGHTDTLWSLLELSMVCARQKRFTEAESMCREVVEGREKILGKDERTTIRAAFILGGIYNDQEKFEEAEKQWTEVLERRDKTLGRRHGDTLHVSRSLASCLCRQGKVQEAMRLYERILETHRDVLGSSHSSTLQVTQALGNIYLEQDKLEEAQPLLQQALAGYKATKGPEHRHTILASNNIGRLQVKKGNLQEAEKLHLEALEAIWYATGSRDLSPARVMNDIGLLRMAQGRLEDAEKTFQRSISRDEEFLSPEHHSTLGTVNNLGRVYALQGKLQEAEMMYQRALCGFVNLYDIEKRFLPLTVVEMFINMGDLLVIQGGLVTAKDIYCKALSGLAAGLGESCKLHEDVKEKIARIDVQLEEEASG